MILLLIMFLSVMCLVATFGIIDDWKISNLFEKIVSIFCLFVCWILIISMWLNYVRPHHCLKPTKSDVPTEAHIDTVNEIRGNDTTYRYEYVWND